MSTKTITGRLTGTPADTLATAIRATAADRATTTDDQAQALAYRHLFAFPLTSHVVAVHVHAAAPAHEAEVAAVAAVDLATDLGTPLADLPCSIRVLDSHNAQVRIART